MSYKEKHVGEMTDKEFDLYLKKHKLTGMAAVSAGAKRRRYIKTKGQ